ncbi:MAG: hypothetical protein HY830_08425 [Actinobacteria bacterium]|nr:hypothetical protein [Actinomycetota bacterium]
MTVTDLLGWAGSALLVYSLLQARVLRFRLLNLAASLVLVVFNAVIAVWPMVAMNVVIAVINVWHTARLLRTRHDDLHYEVVPITADEPYLRYVVDRHRADIERFNPDLDLAGHLTAPGAGALAFLVLADGETVGVVLAHGTGTPGEAQVDLDYVLPRFRDFTPGEFVYRAGGPFSRSGVDRVLAPPRMLGAERYLRDVGFRPDGGALVLELTAGAGPAAGPGAPAAR